ncbi:MAG: L-seryl-tRNA(Sec) selenium transferase, partial [Gammaproteobacteria bacterium]
LPRAAPALRPPGRPGRAPARLAAAYRALPLPVIGRVAEGALLFDLRCLEDADALLAQLPRLVLPGAAR